jgi:hypothetical protein
MIEIIREYSWALFFTVLGASIFGLCISLYALYFVRRQSISGYDASNGRARLSKLREAYDRRLIDLVEELTSTKERWQEVNHLLTDNQRLQSASPPGPNTKSSLTLFLQNAGITESDLEIDPELILVLTPFDREFDDDYRAVKTVCDRNGFRCVRGDEQDASGDIFRHILRIMVHARLVIANISGRNPNVFYELGIANAVDKITILICRTRDKVPFDVQSNRILFYEDVNSLQLDLKDMLLRALRVEQRAGHALMR